MPSEPIPPGTDLLAAEARLSFLDRQAVTLARPLSAIEAWNRATARPLPLIALAFRLRDAISARFGVARIGGFSGRQQTAPKVGDRLDFFLVERADPDRLTLTSRDRHLDVMTCITTAGLEVAITASVITHNGFGRAYMLVVAPAHRIIVRGMLRRLRAEIADQAG